MFLSATPHNGHPESFTALLEMVDGRRFSRGATLDEKALREVTVRRLKSEIKEKDFKARKVERIVFEPTADEQEAFADLDRILTESAKANGRKPSGDIVSMLLKKRFLSSPWAFARTIELYEHAGASRGLPELDDGDEYYQEVLGSGQSDEEEGQVEQPEFTTLRRSKGSDPLVAAQPGEIAALANWGRGYESQPDSRLSALVTWLDSTCRIGKLWSNERVVIFTEYSATLDWIVDILRQRGYADRLAAIQGSTPHDEREIIRARFNEDPATEPLRILVATDSAGEGIDLQSHCRHLINFDIPFNPSRLEQRIGRVDRYGQRQVPEIRHFTPSSGSTTYGADLKFMDIIAHKVALVAQDLGSVNQVIDAEIQEHFIPGRSSGRRSAVVDPGNAIITRTLAGGIELNRQLTELSRTYADRKAAMHLTPENARRVLDTALEMTAQPPMLEIGDADTNAQVFDVPALGPSWQPALRGLDTRLKPGQWRPITFDDQAAANRNDLVHVHLGHALMQKAARLLRGALFSADSSVHRVTAVVIDDLPQSCVAAVSRLVLVGRGGLRLHEDVFLTGVRMRGQAMAEDKVVALLDTALDGQHLRLAGEGVRLALSELWNAESGALRGKLLDAMTRRAETRQEQVRASLLARRDADLSRANGIFGAFRLNLEESAARLAREIENQEVGLFTDDQQLQRQRDLNRMRDRLAGLRAEQERELDTIAERYQQIKPHVAAAAVVFALTPADAADLAGGAA